MHPRLRPETGARVPSEKVKPKDEFQRGVQALGELGKVMTRCRPICGSPTGYAQIRFHMGKIDDVLKQWISDQKDRDEGIE